MSGFPALERNRDKFGFAMLVRIYRERGVVDWNTYAIVAESEEL
jgi:hypothetical protein